MSQFIKDHFENIISHMPNLSQSEKDLLADEINLMLAHVANQTRYNPNFKLQSIVIASIPKIKIHLPDNFKSINTD